VVYVNSANLLQKFPAIAVITSSVTKCMSWHYKSFPLEVHQSYFHPEHNAGSLTHNKNIWFLDICSIECGSVGFSERDVS